jgi:hypothetical protein
MTMSLLFAAAAAAAQPSPEAIALAREIAGHGTLAQIAPLQTQSEVEEMIRDHPELTEAEGERLRAIGERQTKALLDKALDAEARAMAAELSLADLRQLAAFNSSPAATHQRAALPKIMAATMAAMGDVDYAGGVRAAFCAESGKLCEKK